MHRTTAYFSVSLFRLARPIAKSLPIMLSMLMNTCITLDIKGAGPCIAQVRLVASPCGSIVNSAVLCPSNGVKKSNLMTIFEGTEASRISIRPEPTFLLPSHGIDRALAAISAAVSALHRGILVFVRRPGSPLMEIVDQGEDFFRRRLDRGRALHAESIRLGHGEDEYDRDGDRKYNGDDGNDLEHGRLRYL